MIKEYNVTNVTVYMDELLPHKEDNNLATLCLPKSYLNEWLGNDNQFFGAEGTADMLVGLVSSLIKDGYEIYKTKDKWTARTLEEWCFYNTLLIADAMKYDEVAVEYLDNKTDVDITFQPFIDSDIACLDGPESLDYIEKNFTSPILEAPYFTQCYSNTIAWLKKAIEERKNVTFDDFIVHLGNLIRREWRAML